MGGTETDGKQSSCRNPFPHSHYESCWCSGLKKTPFRGSSGTKMCTL